MKKPAKKTGRPGPLKKHCDRMAEQIHETMRTLDAPVRVPPISFPLSGGGGEFFDRMLKLRFDGYHNAAQNLRVLADLIADTQMADGFKPAMGDGTIVIYWRSRR